MPNNIFLFVRVYSYLYILDASWISIARAVVQYCFCGQYVIHSQCSMLLSFAFFNDQ